MALKQHFRKLENMYHSAPVNRFYHPVLHVERDRAEIVMEVREEFFHAAGAVHGSVFFKMMDDAAFFAANSTVEDRFFLTVSFNSHFLRPVAAGSLRAEGSVVQRSRGLVLAEAVLVNADGKDVARGSGSFVKSRIPLDEAIGYL